MGAAVSIIIPSYQQSHQLKEAIESCLRQSFSPVEIIVVDDGSTDDTKEVATHYGDKINYIYKLNGGVSSARNEGIRAAVGRYLHFLDADDLLHPNSIEWLVECMGEKEDRLCLMGFRLFWSDPNAPNDAVPSNGVTWFRELFKID